MITDSQAEQIYEAMLEMWPHLPNPDHEPKRFEYYMKMFKYVHSDKIEEIKNGSTEQQPAAISDQPT